MAQVLQEDTQKINTIERLTRNLGKEIPEPVRDNYLNVAMNFVPKDLTKKAGMDMLKKSFKEQMKNSKK